MTASPETDSSNSSTTLSRSYCGSRFHEPVSVFVKGRIEGSILFLLPPFHRRSLCSNSKANVPHRSTQHNSTTYSGQPFPAPLLPTRPTTKVGWPLQTKSEDEGCGLEPFLADIVTTARDWLVARCFVNVDGPWVGGAAVGWRQTTVMRTHAAMCADSILRPYWGAGHCIMGFAEQARYRRSCKVILIDFARFVAGSK